MPKKTQLGPGALPGKRRIITAKTEAVDNILTKIAGVPINKKIILYANTGDTLTVTPSAFLQMANNFTLTGNRSMLFLSLGSDVCREISRSANT